MHSTSSTSQALYRAMLGAVLFSGILQENDINENIKKTYHNKRPLQGLPLETQKITGKKKEIKALEYKFIKMLEQVKDIYLHFNKDLPAYLQHDIKNIDALLFKIIPDNSMSKKQKIYSATEKLFFNIIPMTVFSLKNTHGKELLN